MSVTRWFYKPSHARKASAKARADLERLREFAGGDRIVAMSRGEFFLIGERLFPHASFKRLERLGWIELARKVPWIGKTPPFTVWVVTEEGKGVAA